MTYTIKNYRTLSSGAYTASLYKDGKRVATIEDDGHGGEPNVYPTSTTAPLWAAREAVLNELTAWAQSNVPEWYTTTFGTHRAMIPNWELAVGYLIEQIEYNRLAKNGQRLVRLNDGSLRLAPMVGQITVPGALVWRNGDWIAPVAVAR